MNLSGLYLSYIPKKSHERIHTSKIMNGVFLKLVCVSVFYSSLNTHPIRISKAIYYIFYLSCLTKQDTDLHGKVSFYNMSINKFRSLEYCTRASTINIVILSTSRFSSMRKQLYVLHNICTNKVL